MRNSPRVCTLVLFFTVNVRECMAGIIMSCYIESYGCQNAAFEKCIQVTRMEVRASQLDGDHIKTAYLGKFRHRGSGSTSYMKKPS